MEGNSVGSSYPEGMNLFLSSDFNILCLFLEIMKPPRVYTRGILPSSLAESAEAPSFALRASEGPTVAFIHGHTPMVFCEGG